MVGALTKTIDLSRRRRGSGAEAVRRPTPSIPKPAMGMLAVRSFFGVNYTPSWTSLPAKAGWPAEQLNGTARFFAAVFGIRELLMVAMVIGAARTDADHLRRSLALSAAVDAFDATAAGILAATHKPLRRPALMSAITATLSATLGATGAAMVD